MSVARATVEVAPSLVAVAVSLRALLLATGWDMAGFAAAEAVSVSITNTLIAQG